MGLTLPLDPTFLTPLALRPFMTLTFSPTFNDSRPFLRTLPGYRTAQNPYASFLRLRYTCHLFGSAPPTPSSALLPLSIPGHLSHV